MSRQNFKQPGLYNKESAAKMLLGLLPDELDNWLTQMIVLNIMSQNMASDLRETILHWQEEIEKEMKKGPHPITKCPKCGGQAMLGYKDNSKMGKCGDCKRIFWENDEHKFENNNIFKTGRGQSPGPSTGV